MSQPPCAAAARSSRRLVPLLLMSVFLLPGRGRSEDWPTWRHDARRSAASAQELAPQLHLQWTRDYPRLQTAWPDQPKLVFDRAYEPVVLGTTLFFGSSRTDSLTALDTRTGAEKWVFHAGGPVRFAPAAGAGKVYFACDDGHLYCLDAADGRLLWKFRGGPSGRQVLGNGRLITAWPARGAPVIADGTVYFAAGIWPFMGIFLHALDAHTGAVVWTNDGDGSIYIKQPHNADAFAGVAPQGPLTVRGDRLLVPGGRSVPACYDRRTGKLLYYNLAPNGKLGGGPDAAAVGRFFCNGGALFDLETGTHLASFSKEPVLAEDRAFGCASTKLLSFDPRQQKDVTREVAQAAAATLKRSSRWSPAGLHTLEVPAAETMIRAGSRLFFASPGQIAALDLPLPKEGKPSFSWRAAVAGTPVRLLAADDRLFAVTLEGRLHCFGAEQARPTAHPSPTPPAVPQDEWTAKAGALLDTTGVREGYCVAWGAGTGRLVTELVRQSRLHVVVVERDARQAEQARRQLIAAGLYGERVSVHHADPLTFPLPPYLAGLMVSEDLDGAGVDLNAEFLRKAYQILRPYGGTAHLPVPAGRRETVARLVGSLALDGAAVRETSTGLLLTRTGALPGSANWTHEHADAANTRVSADRLVKAPLGLLWFGGSSNLAVLPRHGHGPQPQVVDGRMIVEGVDLFRALDIYTGRVLWEADLPGVGRLYNTIPHQAGANATGTNYISTSDGIYILHGKVCVRLDPATGKKLSEFRLPGGTGSKESSDWGYLNVSDDLLVAGTNPAEGTPDEGPNRQLQVWGVAKRKQLATLDGHQDDVTAVGFSPDGKTLATASEDRSVRVWDATTHELRHTLEGHEKAVLGLDFSPDGRALATASADTTVRLWDLATGKPATVLKGHTRPVLAVAFSADSKELTSTSEGTVKEWEVASGRVQDSLEGIADDATSVAFSPSGALLAIGASEGAVKVWDLDRREVRHTLTGHTQEITLVAFSADGKTLATGSRDKTVKLWDLATGRSLVTLKGPTSLPTCAAFTPDGKTLAVGADDASVALWDLAEPEVTATLKGRPGAARAVAFAPDGKTFILGGTEKQTALRFDRLASSKQLVLLDRHSGAIRWSVTARSSFRHNTVCLGGGRLYAIDRPSESEMARLKRLGQEPTAKPRLVALDLKSGSELWSTEANVFGTWLSYSARHDVLVEAGRMARDTLRDEPRGMRAYKAGDGAVLWSQADYRGPAMIHGDTILKDGSACDLLTGTPRMRRDPVTGQEVEWTWTRTYGCNTPAASECLLTFRSGAAGYYDLAGDGGTGNFGGFRSSCTNNLIVAGGLLTAPDYTRNCTCSYQNQCSLALVHMPEVEMWTKFPRGSSSALASLVPSKLRKPAEPLPVQRLGLNLGAPGDRRAEDGRLWLNDYEHARVKYEAFGFYNQHSSRVVSSGVSPAWVVSSGCRGIAELALALRDPAGPGKTSAYTVRLHFADPDNDQPGRRVFDVVVQGQVVISGLDVVKETGGRNRAVVKELPGVEAGDKLTIRFVPSHPGPQTPATAPLLCGLEVDRK